MPSLLFGMNISRARWLQLNRILVVDENREAQKKAVVFRDSRMLVCFRVLVDSATDFNIGIFQSTSEGFPSFHILKPCPSSSPK